jgi:site-specific recombinase XerD
MQVHVEDIRSFSQYLREKGKQPATIESYTRDLATFLEYLQQCRISWEQLESSTLIFYQKYLSTERQAHPNSIRRGVISIRQFFRYLAERETTFRSPFDEVAIPSRQESLPSTFQEKDLQTLLCSLHEDDSILKSTRDMAIISLLAYEGLKANEIVSLRWTHYLPHPHYTTIKVEGKRARIIQVIEKTAENIKKYRAAYIGFNHMGTGKKEKERMFFAFQGKDLTPYKSLSRHGLKFMLYERGEKAGISNLHTEILREHAIQTLIKMGRTPEEIMAHLGLLRLGRIARLLRK